MLRDQWRHDELDSFALHRRQRFVRHRQRRLDVRRRVRGGQEPVVMRVEQGAAARDFAAEALPTPEVRIDVERREG